MKKSFTVNKRGKGARKLKREQKKKKKLKVSFSGSLR